MSPIARLALPVLAAAGYAYAAECSVSATTTIQNSGDATALASCETFTGSIAVETSATENIAFDGIQKIDGNLVVKNNTAIHGISGSDLEEITGTFQLDEIQLLDTVSFPKLKSVDTLLWNALPNLQTLGFDAEITEASVIDIQNTQLGSLQGINIEIVDEVKIANNRFINEISMQLGNITKALTLEANNPEVNVTFPNLIWAFNMTFRNCSSVELASLESLNGSLGLYGNVFTNFAAPNLTDIGGALAIVSNTELTNISLPQLTTVKQNLQIANNTKLSEINSIPKLKTIGGALDFNGNMSEVDIPSLNDVKGAFNLQSTGDIQKTCDDFFEPLKDKGRIQGKFVCVGSVENPGGQGTTPNGSGGKKPNAASTLDIQSTVLFVGLAAAFFL